MKPQEVVLSGLCKKLSEHFPAADPEEVKRIADDLLVQATTAKSMQWIERNDTEPTEAARHLREAALQIRKATVAVSSSGFVGGNQLINLAREIFRQRNKDYPGVPALGVEDSLAEIAGHLNFLAFRFENASNQIARARAAPMMYAFGHEKPANQRRGAPALTQAHLVAREVGRAFAELGGREPTVSVDAHTRGHPAGGPFLRLLEDLFEVLGISASAETWAKTTCKERKAESR